MIDWINSWAQGIIIAVIISTIIEMILPEGKIKKYVQTIIGVYIVFIIVSPIITKITGKEISLKNYVIPENNINYETIDTNAYIENTYIESIKKEIMKTIEEAGYTAKDIEIQIESSEENYGNINLIKIQLQKEEKISNQIEPIKIDIEENIEEKETISEEERVKLKEIINQNYGTKIEKIYINE